MKLNRNRQFAAVILLSLAVISQGCGGNAVHESKKAAHRIQVVTDAATDTTTTLFHDGIIDKARTNEIAKILLKINSGNRVLINKAEAATVDSPAVRGDLLDQLQIIEDAVKELKAAGVLAIKSKSGQLAYESAIAALDSSIAIIRAALRSKK